MTAAAVVTKGRKAALLAVSDSLLIQSLTNLEHTVRVPETNLVKSWIREELERRYPAVEASMDAWSFADGSEVRSYSEALRDALAALGVTA